MSSSNLKLDEVPIVHAAYIFSSYDIVTFHDREFESISQKIQNIEGKPLSSIIKKLSKKALRTHKTITINDNEIYEIYVLYGSSDDKMVFLVDGNTPFTHDLPLQEEEESALLILPFLDAALLRFLERTEIYGTKVIPSVSHIKTPKKHDRSQSRSSLRMNHSKESFSLEEVFRELDVDGNGSIDLDEFKHGISHLMASSTISDNDLELVFKAISMNGIDITWRGFYSFFDGNKLRKSSSRRHKMTLSTQLNNILPDLGTLNEDEQTETLTVIGLSDIVTTDEHKDEQTTETESNKYIQKVKQSIRECLNLGTDSGLLQSPVSVSSFSSFTSDDLSAFKPHHGVQNSSAAIPTNTDEIEVAQSLMRIENTEDLMELMEHNIFLVPDTHTMTKWENRYQSHKIRVNNFRKILNGMLSQKIVLMRDENTILREQLEGVRGSDEPQSFQDLAQLHTEQFSTLKSFKISKSSRKKPKNRHYRISSDTTDDYDDTSSVDSEVNLVYTEGTKLDTKESETLLKRVKLQKKEIKHLTKQNKKLKKAHKLELIKYKRLIDSQGTKMKSYEKHRKSMVFQRQKIQKEIHKVRNIRSNKGENLKSNLNKSASNKREISIFEKKLKDLHNKLEREQERNKNLEKKLKRAVSAANRESGKYGDDTSNRVLENKLKRLQKEKDKIELQCAAKTKKNEDLFLKLGAAERKYGVVAKENAELKAKLGSYSSQIRDIERRTKQLKSITGERDRAFTDIGNLEKRLMKANEGMAKLKSRNRKLKERIKQLLLKIEELNKISMNLKKLMNELRSIQQELGAVEAESAKFKNQNDALNAKIAELRANMNAKRTQFESQTTQLERIQEDLSTEWNTIRTLMEQIETNRGQMSDLEKENEELSLGLIRSEAQIESSQKIIARYKEKTEKYSAEIEGMNEKLMNYEQNEMVKLRGNIGDLEEVISRKDEEIKLWKTKYDEIQKSLNTARGIEDKIKEKNDEIDDLMNRIEILQNKLSGSKDRYGDKCHEYDGLCARLKKLEKEIMDSNAKIGRLNIKIRGFETKKMQHSDEVKLQIKQYEVQIVRIEENKKLIEKLRQEIGEFKTKWELEKEAVERYKKAEKTFGFEAEERDKTIKKQKKKIKDLQKGKDATGAGDKKMQSTLSLLRKNVDEMESIIRTKDFDIRKLTNNLKAMERQAPDPEEIKRLRANVESAKQGVSALKEKNETHMNEVNANRELLKSKNEELSQLKEEISQLKEDQEKVMDEQKENEDLHKRMSIITNKKDQNIEKLTDKIEELSKELNRVKTEKQRKIDALEAELADQESILENIGTQIGTEVFDDDD